MPRPVAIPALVPISAAFLAGAAFGGPRPGALHAAAAGAVALLTTCLLRRRPRTAMLSLVVSALAFGAALSAVRWEASVRRQQARFGETTSLEREVLGTVLAAPERSTRGERWLQIRTSTPPLTARVVVAPPSLEDVVRLDALRYGDAVRVWCRLRAPARGPGRDVEKARRSLWSQGLDATGSVKSSRLVQLDALGPASWRRVLDEARAAARASLDRSLGPDSRTRAVMGAMLLGDRALGDDETGRLLRDSGLVHLLSISGLHTAITIVLLVALLRRAGTRSGALALTAAVAIVAFSAFVGWGSPVLRAGVMVLVALVARAVGREIDGLTSLALASALLVAAEPTLAMDLSFQLSVLATAGLLALGPSIARVLPGPRIVAKGLGVSAGAYLATAPSLALAFGRAAPVALLANLAAGILCAFSLAAGAAVLALGRLPVVGPWAIVAAHVSVEALVATARAAAAIPGGHLRIATPSTALVVLDVALLVMIIALPRGRARRRCAGALAFVTVALHLGPRPPGAGPTRIEVLDVGQGLAVLVSLPGEMILVDAGPGEPGRFDAGERLVVPAILARGGRRISILALSHGHADHIGGAPAVLEDLEVGELWFPAGAEHDPPMRRVLDLAREKGVALRRMRRGDRVARGGGTLEIPHPADGDRRGPINDRCLVLWLRAPEGGTALLPGDLESAGESALLLRHTAVSADALVVPHHGADGSSGSAFLRSVGAGVAIVSAGATNRFGHPGAKALERLTQAGARIHRTDRNGTVSLEATSDGWRVSDDLEGDRDEREDEHEPER